MQTKIVKLDAVNIDVAKIKKAAQLVDDGGLVGFPTETVYGIASRTIPDSLIKLDKLKCRAPGKYYTLHIAEKTDVVKYVPAIGLKTQKLIENMWPGPLTIVFELTDHDMEKQRNRLEKEVFQALYKNNSIGIRCPDNTIASALLRETRRPVVAPSANTAGQPPATEASQVLAQFSDQIELLLDGGPCKYTRSSTVVKIDKQKLQILRAGIYSQAQLEAISQVNFLFVCTGNTCRSPMAEGMFKKYLAEKLGCKVDQLEKKGYKVASAGIAGIAELPASPQAVAVCAAKGIDIRAHRSTALSGRIVDDCDFIFAMSRMHRDRVAAFGPEAANKCVLLAGDKAVPDPIGQPQQVYDNCGEQIEKAVKKRMSEFVI